MKPTWHEEFLHEWKRKENGGYSFLGEDYYCWPNIHATSIATALEMFERWMRDQQQNDQMERPQRNEPLEKLKPNVYFDDNP